MMKKQFIRACSWAVALLLGSIAGGCSSARKAAKAAEQDVAEPQDTVVTPAPVEPKVLPEEGQRIRLLYGVRPTDFELKDR